MTNYNMKNSDTNSDTNPTQADTKTEILCQSVTKQLQLSDTKFFFVSEFVSGLCQSFSLIINMLTPFDTADTKKCSYKRLFKKIGLSRARVREKRVASIYAREFVSECQNL